jgi:hypothetical protein
MKFSNICYSLWLHPLLIPSYAALASIIVLILHIIFSIGPIKLPRTRISSSTEDTNTAGEYSASSTRTGLLSAVKDHVERSGGSIIFVFRLARLVLVISLLVLSIFCFLQEEVLHSADSGLDPLNKHWGKRRKPKHRDGGGGSLSKREWLDLAACLNYVCLLAALSVPPLINFSKLGIAICFLLSPRFHNGSEDPRIGGLVPPLLDIVYHILGLYISRYMATAYFHTVTS